MDEQQIGTQHLQHTSYESSYFESPNLKNLMIKISESIQTLIKGQSEQQGIEGIIGGVLANRYDVPEARYLNGKMLVIAYMVLEDTGSEYVINQRELK